MTSWHPLPGADLSNKPRRLTEQELQSIIDAFPDVRAADQRSAVLARDNITTWIRNTLSKLEICPSAIPALIKRIYDSHIRSMIAPGTPIGIAAAEAVGATTTQMTLNSVHPAETIFLQYASGRVYYGSIGSWIDNLLSNYSDQIQFIPQNRTEYLPLSESVYILSPDAQGKIFWSEITAVTRHLPIGPLVRVTLPHGESVRVTRSKSLLLWNGKEFTQEPGSAAQVGDLMPLIKTIPPPIKEIEHIQCGSFKVICNSTLGLVLATYIAYGEIFDNKIVLRVDSMVQQEIISWCCSYGIIRTTNLGLIITSNKLADFFLSACGTDNRYLPADILCANLKTINGIFRGFAEVDIHHLMNKYSLLASQLNILAARTDGMVRKWQVQEDVYLTPCLEVQDIPASKYVYDLTVPSTTNFCLANGIGVADTFHTSGSSKSATSGIEAMRDLILARQNPKNEHSTIYFNNKNMSYADVLNSRRFIVGSTFSDFIEDYRIHPLREIQDSWWLPYWNNTLRNTTEDTMILALQLNLSEMYKHHVSLHSLQEAIANSNDNSIQIIYGPISSALFYIIPIRQFIWSTLNMAELSDRVSVELAEITFLDTIVMPKVQTLLVKGVPDIRYLTPKVSRILEMILQESPLILEQVTNPAAVKTLQAADGDLWLLYLNKIHMRDTGLTVANLQRLLSQADIQIILVAPEKVAVSVPKSWNNIKPSKVIQQLIERDNKTIADQVKIEVDANIAASRDPTLSPDQRRELILSIPQVPPTPLLLASEYVIAEAEGCNLMELLALPYIDKTRTICTNMHSIAKALGIEAARSFIIKSLLEIISNNSYVHPAHIIFIAEFLTSRGQPLGATHTGISRQPVGHLTLSTVSQSMKVLANSALAGKSENVRNLSAAIMLGSRAAVGTGYFDIAQDVTIQGLPRTLINDEVLTEYVNADQPKPIAQPASDNLMAGLQNLLNLMPGVQSTADNPIPPLERDFYPEVQAGFPAIGPITRQQVELIRTAIETTGLVTEALPRIVPLTDIPDLVRNFPLEVTTLPEIPDVPTEGESAAFQGIEEVSVEMADPAALLQYLG